MEDLIGKFRYYLKDDIRQTIDFSMTDQNRGVPPPPVEKPYAAGSELIELPGRHALKGIAETDLISAIEKRKSHRMFKPTPLTLEEISFLLWATQGVRHRAGGSVFRNVPSAGCRHALETYLSVHSVTGLEKGIYRYLPLEHKLLAVLKEDDVSVKLISATLGQSFTGNAPVAFVWTAVPYRMEWRYHLAAHKVIAIDAGHVCQNLYLASAAIGGGTCAVAAYHQEMLDRLLGIDGIEEFAIYLAAVGKV